MTLDIFTEVNRPARGTDLHVVGGQGAFVAMLPFRMCLPGVHSDFIFTELWRLLQLRDKWITTQNYVNSKAVLKAWLVGWPPQASRIDIILCNVFRARRHQRQSSKMLSYIKNTEHGTNMTSVEMMHEVSRDTTPCR
jgi:hypothetical protein